MPQVLFTKAAEADFADALAWYDTQAPDVASAFEQAVDAMKHAGSHRCFTQAFVDAFVIKNASRQIA